jgi:hypothetical protein
MEAIVEASPHRVAISALARVEVYQGISKTQTPEGPHTHVLPKLIASGRTHSANVPVPEGYLPCLALYPANPLFDGLGRDKPFDRVSFAAFQELLKLWGRPEYCAQKARAMAAVREGRDPAAHEQPQTRLGRAALRIALRQLRRIEGDDPFLMEWCKRFDGLERPSPD